MREGEIKEVNCIFEQPWWLDAVAPNEWECVVVENNGNIVGRLPYIIRKKSGITKLSQAPLTQTLGPWILKKEAKKAKVLAWEKDILTELINKLPKFDSFQQNFNYSITNWMPFYWNNFQQTTKYTYVINDLTNLEKIWDGFLENIRTDIRKAEKKLTLRTDLGIDEFLKLHAKTFSRQGLEIQFDTEVLKRLDKACGDQSRRIFFAEDADKKIHAAIYIVWDAKSAYYLLGGSDPELRNSGANSFLLWEAIKFASTVSDKFDFEGSMIEPIERFFRAFGGTPLPYYSISKIAPKLQIRRNIRNIINLLRQKINIS